jgi:probable Rubsico expression protein CbbX
MACTPTPAIGPTVTATGSGFAMPRPGATGEVTPRAPAPARPLPSELDDARPLGTDPDVQVDLDALRAELGVSRTLDELDATLVGLAPVKQRLRQIEALLLVDQLRRRLGLQAPRPNLHMCFAGPPGTGKTTVASKMAGILHALGYLPTDRLVTVTREDLVGQYVGHTAPKTKEVLQRAMGGVLFIDEAYALHRPDNERDYGQEAIEMLLAAMEDHRDRLVVILAGYADRMDGFFALNPGLRSRIAHHLDFPEFETDELVAIGHRMLADQGYELAPAAEAVFRSYVELRRGQPHFANARSIRNAIERTRLRHAARLVATGGLVDRDTLRLLQPEDLLGSSIFDDPLPDPVGDLPDPVAGSAPVSGGDGGEH